MYPKFYYSLTLAAALAMPPASSGAGEAGTPPSAEPAMGRDAGLLAGMIQTATLDPGVPLFIPTHPRVTTTLRFPGPPGAPEGRGFTEDEGRTPGEYLVAWTQGDHHLAVTPLGNAGPLNLNIPYAGETYVFYFYPVEKQFKALTSLRLRSSAGNAGGALKAPVPPRGEKANADTTQLLGLMDKLKLLAATQPGRGRQQLAAALGLSLWQPPGDRADVGEAVQAHTRKTSAEDVLHIAISQVVADPSLGTLGFAIKARNAAGKALALDGTRFSLKCGGRTLHAKLTEGPSILTPGESAELLLIVLQEGPAILRPENDWQVDLHPQEAETVGVKAQGQGEQTSSPAQKVTSSPGRNP